MTTPHHRPPMPAACHHPGTLDRRPDGAHCPRCDALIYPAHARTTPAEPPPAPAPVPAPTPAGADR